MAQSEKQKVAEMIGGTVYPKSNYPGTQAAVLLIGKPSCDLKEYDWEGFWPVIDDDEIVREIVTANDAPNIEGIFFDGILEAYRYE